MTMRFRSGYLLSFVTMIVLSLILAMRAATAADQIVFPPHGSGFGYAIDIEGDFAVNGNPYFYRPDRQVSGVVYVFERGTTGWQLVKHLRPPVAVTRFSRFGTQVTLAGNRMAVGDAHFGESDLAAGLTGRVYVYEKQGSIWPDEPTYVIEPSQTDVFSFGQTHAFSGEYLAVTDMVSFNSVQPDQMVVRVRTYRLHNGQAILLGQVESTGGDYFGFEMSMSGSELAILNARKGMLLPPTQGTVLLYDLSGGTMRQTAILPVPMEEGDLFSTPKVKLEGDCMLIWKSTPPGGGGIYFKRTGARWQATSQSRSRPRGALSEDLMDMAGNALVINSSLGTDLYTASESPRFVRRLDTGSPYSLATSPDTAMIVRSNQVLFTSLKSLVAADTVVVDPSDATRSGGVIDLGKLVAGKACDVEVELQNASTEPLQLTGVQIMPTIGANSVTEHSFVPVTLPPLGKTRVKLTLNPPSAGSYQMTLVVLHPDAAIEPFAYRVEFEASAEDFAPSVSETAGSVLVVKGEPVKLQADAEGTRGRFNCQWYKDGRLLQGRTQPFLFVSSAQPTDAGRYRLDVWSEGSPRKSCRMGLGVFERKAGTIFARPGDSINLRARFWGPNIRVRWREVYQNRQLPETWAVQGTESATLRIQSPMALAGNGQVWINADLVMDEAVSVISNDHLIEVPRVPIIQVTGPRHGRVGEQLPRFTLSDLTNNVDGAVFSAKGLPAGVQLTNSGYGIGGVPTEAGNYMVTIMAENRYGSAVPFKMTLKIYSAEEEPKVKLNFGRYHRKAGTIMIPTPNTESLEWPGLLRLQTTSGRGFSGSLAFGTVRRSFSGQWTTNEEWGSRTATVRLTRFLGYRSVKLVLVQGVLEEDSSWNDTSATLFLDNASPDGGVSETQTSLESVILMNKDWNHALKGRYSFLMGGLAGQGFGAFTVGSDFQARGVGVLANGRRFTFSMPVVVDRDSPSNGTVMLVRLGVGRVRMWGRINLMAVGIFEEAGTVSGTLRMARPANPGSRFLPDGYNIELPVQGVHFFARKEMFSSNNPNGSPDEVERPWIYLEGDGLPESINEVLKFSKSGEVIVDQPNASDLKLKVSLRTGYFSGDFKVNELAPGSENRFVRRSVRFSGMMLPQLRIGGGFFHYSPLPNRFAEPPTTMKTRPIYLGGVSFGW